MDPSQFVSLRSEHASVIPKSTLKTQEQHPWVISTAIRQKGKSQTGCYKKTKHAKFSEKRTVFNQIPTRSCGYQGVTNVPFSKNLACFVFL